MTPEIFQDGFYGNLGSIQPPLVSDGHISKGFGRLQQ